MMTMTTDRDGRRIDSYPRVPGVSWIVARRKWLCALTWRKRRITIGWYYDWISCVCALNDARVRLYGVDNGLLSLSRSLALRRNKKALDVAVMEMALESDPTSDNAVMPEPLNDRTNKALDALKNILGTGE